jgi:DNA-binding GntR family transcriptional regulator
VKVTHVVAPVRAQVVEQIRAEIISGALVPGQRLIERELCEQLNVSRNTLREAFRQLEAEGFLEIPPHKGPLVARLNDREALDIYELRQALESFAVRLFVERADDVALARLLTAATEVGAAHAAGDVAIMLEAKSRFYEALYDGSGNIALKTQAGLLAGRLAGLRTQSLSNPGRPGESMREIATVMQYIQSRDADRASALWRDHIHNAAAAAIRSQYDRASAATT